MPIIPALGGGRGGGGRPAVEFTGRPCLEQTTHPDKNKSKTKALFVQIQVCPLVWPTALRVLEGAGGMFGLVAQH